MIFRDEFRSRIRIQSIGEISQDVIVSEAKQSRAR